MKFTGCISGTRVEDFAIVPMFHGNQRISLNEVLEEIHTQTAMDFLLDKYRFTLLDDGKFYGIISIDDPYTLAIMERYPEYEKEMIDYFGNEWYKHYIRYGH